MQDGFYDNNPLKHVVINLFNGWGYNFYRKENQLRADDQLIRTKVGWLLGLARKSIEVAEVEYRRENLPPPTREKPRHDPVLVSGAQTIERLSKSVGALMGQVGSQPVPENDRMTQRYRNEANTLQTLIECDHELIGSAEQLRETVEHKNGAWLIENSASVLDAVQTIGDRLKKRQSVLMS